MNDDLSSFRQNLHIFEIQNTELVILGRVSTAAGSEVFEDETLQKSTEPWN